MRSRRGRCGCGAGCSIGWVRRCECTACSRAAAVCCSRRMLQHGSAEVDGQIAVGMMTHLDAGRRRGITTARLHERDGRREGRRMVGSAGMMRWSRHQRLCRPGCCLRLLQLRHAMRVRHASDHILDAQQLLIELIHVGGQIVTMLLEVMQSDAESTCTTKTTHNTGEQGARNEERAQPTNARIICAAATDC